MDVNYAEWNERVRVRWEDALGEECRWILWVYLFDISHRLGNTYTAFMLHGRSPHIIIWNLQYVWLEFICLFLANGWMNQPYQTARMSDQLNCIGQRKRNKNATIFFWRRCIKTPTINYLIYFYLFQWIIYIYDHCFSLHCDWIVCLQVFILQRILFHLRI